MLPQTIPAVAMPCPLRRPADRRMSPSASTPRMIAGTPVTQVVTSANKPITRLVIALPLVSDSALASGEGAIAAANGVTTAPDAKDVPHAGQLASSAPT